MTDRMVYDECSYMTLILYLYVMNLFTGIINLIHLYIRILLVHLYIRILLVHLFTNFQLGKLQTSFITYNYYFKNNY